jgi:hypothetical protein
MRSNKKGGPPTPEGAEGPYFIRYTNAVPLNHNICAVPDGLPVA